MTTLIVSKDEVKAYLGISGTSKDAQINLWNKTATELLNSILGVQDVALHTVTKEPVTLYNTDIVALAEFPVDTDQTITLYDELYNEIVGYTFTLVENSIRSLQVLNSSGKPTSLSYRDIFVTYNAGYTVLDTMQVTDFSTMATKTFVKTITGVSTTYTMVASSPTGNQILVGADDATTAANIAAAISGASVSTDTVTFPLGTSISFGTLTSSQATLTNATIPEGMKAAVSLLIGGFMSDATVKTGGVVSYSIGSKNVTFSSQQDKNTFETIMGSIMPQYARVKGASI